MEKNYLGNTRVSGKFDTVEHVKSRAEDRWKAAVKEVAIHTWKYKQD